jgi:glutathione S-transferase
MFKIYGMHTPNFIKTVYAAEELGLSYEIVPVDLTKGETRTPEHRARHPFGKVPVLEHDGRFLFESNAIVRYLGAYADSALYPKDPFARATVDQWIDYATLQAGRWTTAIWFQRCIAPKYFSEQTDEKVVADSLENLLTDMPVIEAHLAKNRFFAGADFTLADVLPYALMKNFAAAGLELGDFPSFLRWFDEVAKRPAIRRVDALDL